MEKETICRIIGGAWLNGKQSCKFTCKLSMPLKKKHSFGGTKILI